MTDISRGGDYRYKNPTSIGEPEKVTSWPFKEPEKSTSWKEPEPPKEAPIVLRDWELMDAAARTELIKTRMSPPGTLKLPPLLEAQRLKWGIPDGAFKVRAAFDRVHIFPLDLFDNAETFTGSALFRPSIVQKKDEQNSHRGVLISAGLSACDRLMSHGIELGHIVRTIKNVPHAQECERIGKLSMWYLVMRDGDLDGSETFEEELRSGVKRIVDAGGEDSYCHQLEGKKKQSVFISDNW